MGKMDLALKRIDDQCTKVVAFTVTMLCLFRHSLSVKFGVLGNLSIAVVALFSLFYFFKIVYRGHFSRSFSTIFLIVGFFIATFFSYFAFGIRNEINIPLLGATNFLLPLFFWLVFFEFKRDSAETAVSALINVIVFAGLLNASGAFIQYYISPDIYGLIHHKVYSEQIMYNSNITKRAISFINSPQLLGLFLAFCVGLIPRISITNKALKVLMVLILSAGGILTGTRAFFIFILAFVTFNYVIGKKNILPLLVLLLCPLLIVPLTSSIESISRVVNIYHFLENIESIPNWKVWQEFLTYDSSTFQILFGKGLGVASRGAQQLVGYQILGGSAESFFVQVFFETGLMGLAFFLSVYAVSVINLWSKDRPIAACMLGMLPIMFISPANYGFNMSFIFSGLIAYGLLTSLSTDSNNQHRNRVTP